MENIYYFYDIYPQVFRVNTETLITIASLDEHCRFREGAAYSVTVIPMNHITADNDNKDYPIHNVIAADGRLQFSLCSKEEQPYTLVVQDGENTLCTPGIYAVDDDLCGLLPFKGNMHAHSFRSDGVESPAMVAANYRKAGFDFLAITDHALYEPSLEALRAFEKLDMDFKLFPGEEIHTPHNKIHILSFAATDSVNQFYRDYPDRYESEVRSLMQELSLSDSQEDFEYAASLWAFRKIREFDGMAILAHPNWIIDGAYNIPPDLYRRFLQDQPFDALELINGGDTPYENAQQLAIWHDACCRGCNVPVIGNDDSHGTVNGAWFNIGITYVLSPSGRKEDLITSMKKGLCIAVERYHNEAPHYYGNSRLISLFSFLDEAYFPLHDELCRQEGYFLNAYIQDDPIGEKGMELLKGRVEALRKKYFDIG